MKEIHPWQKDWARLLAVQDRLIVRLSQAWAEHFNRSIAQIEDAREVYVITEPMAALRRG